jgi:hypothetical protein
VSGVRVLAGTRKGAFVLTSDGTRKQWEVSGPHFAGWEIHHVKGSPADPDRLSASQSSGWSGQVIQPMLRGTIRGHDGGPRRAFMRLFACEEDLSHDPPDKPLPDAVAARTEPYLIVGAMAGG